MNIGRLTYLLFCMALAGAAKQKDQTNDFIEKQVKKLNERKVKCGLKKITDTSLENLRLTTEKDEDTVIMCCLQALQDPNLASEHGYIWSVLGTLYKEQGATTQATTCFKQAQKAAGKITPFVKKWHFMGPFVIGKMEVDGDPLEAYGGIRNVSKYRYQKSAIFYSELIPAGVVKWTVIKQKSAEAIVQVKPEVNWNDLVSSLGSVGISEWQGWVVGELVVNGKDQNVIVQCLGVHTIYIDDLPVTGDVYHREKYWFGVNLEQGLHTVYIRLRAKVVANFKCSFQIAKHNIAVFSPHFLPDLVDGHLFSRYLSLPVANYQPTDFLRITKVTLQDIAPVETDLEIQMVDTRNKNKLIAPGQIYLLPLELSSTNLYVIPSCTDTDSSGDVSFTIKITTSSGVQALPIELRCRRFRQSFLFTFIDHDGSVQHAAAIPPLENCPGNLCPTLLTLHGTTIPPQNQADSYKQMVAGEFQFGSRYAWLLAPTRHGAHNWEGPGHRTAITALEELGKITKNTDWITNKADTEHVIFAGHSMGGHGAWHLAVHYPDRCIGLISLAGWIKKEEYGDSNLFFRHDISTSHTDPAVKAIMEASIAENDVDRHVANLKDIPVLARLGANDRTVHPYFVRRMYRLLKEEGVAVNYSEVAGKEHWWWDTIKTNDGGVVNDQTLRDFTNHYVSELLFSSGTCSAGACSGTSGSPKYMADEERNFTVISYNPGLGEGVAGVKIVEQVVPHRQSLIQGYVKRNHVFLKTVNVDSFTIREPANRKIMWNLTTIQIDESDVFSVANIGEKEVVFSRTSGRWHRIDEIKRLMGFRGPERKIAEKPFLIVIGTTGSKLAQHFIKRTAVYIATLFFLTSDTSAAIVPDSEIQEDELREQNVILIGSAEENKHSSIYMDEMSIKIEDRSVKLGPCIFKYDRIGVYSMAPNGLYLALLVMANSEEGLLDVMTLATPTIPPMTRSPFSNLVPDYVITGPEFRRKGPGGYLCAGFWGNDAKYRSDSSSCVC